MLPEGVTTATVTFGKAASIVGANAKVSLSVKPSHDLVWAATGDAIVDFPASVSAEAGAIGLIELPHTDQPGFITRDGREITNWYYTATQRATLGTQTRQWTWVFSLLSGQTEVDLDLLPTNGNVVAPGLGTIPPVLSVNGQTGAVNIAADVDSLPAGGSPGQILTKTSAEDGDADWVDPPEGGGGGGGSFAVPVYDTEAEALAALDAGEVAEGDVVGIEQ